MLRYFVLALSLCLVAGAENEQPSTNIQEEIAESKEYKEAVQNAEALAPEWIAYQQETGKVTDKLAAASFPGADVDPEKIVFTLYSCPSTKTQFSFKDHEKLNKTIFKEDLPTHFLIHGSYQSENIWDGSDLSFEYGIRGKKMNLITVDWSAYANGLYVSQTLYVVPQVSLLVAQMVQILMEYHNVQPNKTRMTGFGTGAHIAGLAGKKLNPKIARITGLDPAGFLYNLFEKEARLDKDDAEEVDTVNTALYSFGMNKAVGKLNFYPSGGRVQKPCEKLSIGKSACSHYLALELFKESITKGTASFVAKSCSNYVDFKNKKCFLNKSNVMGEDVIPQVTEHSYYLEINERPPYSQGINGAYLYNAPQSE